METTEIPDFPTDWTEPVVGNPKKEIKGFYNVKVTFSKAKK